eukprot:1993167-Rhodomonas_salina.7
MSGTDIAHWGVPGCEGGRGARRSVLPTCYAAATRCAVLTQALFCYQAMESKAAELLQSSDFEPGTHPTSLRARYASPGTHVAHGAVCLRASNAMSGTDSVYGTTRRYEGRACDPHRPSTTSPTLVYPGRYFCTDRGVHYYQKLITFKELKQAATEVGVEVSGMALPFVRVAR